MRTEFLEGGLSVHIMSLFKLCWVPLWFECRMSPIGLCIGARRDLFEKAVELLSGGSHAGGDGALMVRHSLEAL